MERDAGRVGGGRLRNRRAAPAGTAWLRVGVQRVDRRPPGVPQRRHRQTDGPGGGRQAGGNQGGGGVRRRVVQDRGGGRARRRHRQRHHQRHGAVLGGLVRRRGDHGGGHVHPAPAHPPGELLRSPVRAAGRRRQRVGGVAGRSGGGPFVRHPDRGGRPSAALGRRVHLGKGAVRPPGGHLPGGHPAVGRPVHACGGGATLYLCRAL